MAGREVSEAEIQRIERAAGVRNSGESRSEDAHAASIQERQRLRAALDHTLSQLEHANEVVGKDVPEWVDGWAERNGLEVTRSEFAPPGQLFIVGTISVRKPRW